MSKKADYLDEVCDKCGWHYWEHERNDNSCPSHHRTAEGKWPGGYHASDKFTPSGRYDESLVFEKKNRKRRRGEARREAY